MAIKRHCFVICPYCRGGTQMTLFAIIFSWCYNWGFAKKVLSFHTLKFQEQFKLVLPLLDNSISLLLDRLDPIKEEPLILFH